jgi:hypothetical protein
MSGGTPSSRGRRSHYARAGAALLLVNERKEGEKRKENTRNLPGASAARVCRGLGRGHAGLVLVVEY